MKTLALALLIPFAICTACAKKEESYATPAPAPVDAAANAPVTPAVSVTPSAPVAPAAAMPAASPGPTSVKVSLISAPSSSVKGDLTVTNDSTKDGSAVSIRGEITGLTPGKEHGFHVHELGVCLPPDFSSAGVHFNPTMDPHGGPNSKARHLGDIQNAKADANGRATIDVSIKGATMGDTDVGPAEILGRSLVVHAMPDDYKTQPSGGSGDRIACAVIR